MRSLFLSSFLALSLLSPASANEDCSRALVISSTRVDDSLVTELSLAYNLSEGEWNEQKKSAAANAAIDGVPLGGSYGEFRSNIKQKSEQFKLNSFERRAYSYATSGIDSNSLQAYQSCLEATEKGIYLLAGAMTDASVEIHLLNSPFAGADPSVKGSVKVPVNIAPDSLDFLKEIVNDLRYADTWNVQVPLRPLDPHKEMSFVVRFGGTVKDLLLPPLQIPSPRANIASDVKYLVQHRSGTGGVVPPGDCAEGTPAGGVPFRDLKHVMYSRVCLSVDGRGLPESFKIDSKTVRVIVPQSCGRATCNETEKEEALKGGQDISSILQCKDQGYARDVCFHILIPCPSDVGASCEEELKLSGEAVEVAQ